MDLKIGNLHAYPNSELQFENYHIFSSVEDGKRQEKRLRGDTQGGTCPPDRNPYVDDVLTFTIDNNTTISVKTPQTFMNGRASCKSQVSRAS